MDTNEDPFPSSLPRIRDTEMTEALDKHGLDFDPAFDDPQLSFSTPYQLPHKQNGRGVVAHSNGLDFLSTHSPESLPDSLSTGSSQVQHRRTHSAESSRSGALDELADAHMTDYSSGPKAIAIGESLMQARVTQEQSPSPDLDTSNRAMESQFDFESAASSPNTYLDMVAPVSFRPKMMPPRSSQSLEISTGVGLHSGRPKSSMETSPVSLMMKNRSSWSAAVEQPHHSLTNAYDTFVNGAILRDRMGEPNCQMDISPVPSQAPDSPKVGTANAFHQSATAMPFASPVPMPTSYQHPTLQVKLVRNKKSRVETLIPLKLTLFSAPESIRKLHLQPYTMAKLSLVENPPPKKTQEMLDLHVMVVCASAMNDAARRARAFERAAGPQPIIPIKSRASSSGDSASQEDDEDKPSNGGPVHICRGCIERERKRSTRKLVVNHEEEVEWRKDETKRTIIFSGHEVVDWVKPTLPKSEEENAPSFQYQGNTIEVSLSMRITCYCRHQNEKLGFQVIFTLKDHLEKVVTQTVSEAIMITDDHKTQAPHGAMPGATARSSGRAAMPVQANPHAPSQNPGLGLYRQAYSTNDLAGMHQEFNAQHFDPYTMPQITPQITSTNFTPKILSRAASPSARLGQQHKKRKASSCGRVRPNDLAMTKLQSPAGTTFPNNGVSSVGQSVAPGPGGASAFAPAYVPPYGLIPQHSGPAIHQVPLQYNMNTSTSSTADNACFSPTQRSQSMEDLQGFSGVLSTPDSIQPSRAPSPTPGEQGNGIPQWNAQTLADSLQLASGTVQPHQSYQTPVINKLTPPEGSKSGGMEVICLGSGFHRGLEVLFGDSQATTTTFWGENAICCLVPPALRAGTVPVTFKRSHEQRVVEPPKKLAIFNYIDDDEQELMKQALTLVNSRFNHGVTDASDSARHIINMFGVNPSFISGAPQGGSNRGSSYQHAASGYESAIAGMADLETATLGCLNMVDLDESPQPANLNAQSKTGQSMLHLSASLGYYRLTAGLLARGANPDIRDRNGLSPMHMASLRGYPRTIRKLRSAGADPTLRTLNGFTPADMATSGQTYEASNALDHHTRSKSAGATPTSYLSRASSVASGKSSREFHTGVGSAEIRSGTVEDDKLGQPITSAISAQAYARSRRNSLAPEQQYPNEESQGDAFLYASMSAANLAMSAWRDQLAAQIQHLQQSMHRTLPNLPIPNLPDYQAYPVVKRISQMVPQRGPRPGTASENTGSASENEHHWWELKNWQTSSPPAYEEIYPEKSGEDMSGRQTSILCVVGEKCKGETNLDQAESSSTIDTVDLGASNLTKSQREQLRAAHAKKMKRLKSDRNLFMIWIPLLILVVGAMLKDRIPHVVEVTRLAFGYIQGFRAELSR